MKVDMEIFDSWSESALQDLLIDVAAVAVATEPGRARNGNNPARTQCGVSRNTPPGWQMRSTAGII
jgi:hypothetical protein